MSYQDDVFIHLESDVDKMRGRFRQYISYSNEKGALALFIEALFNAWDECKNPRSPGDKIWISVYDDTGYVTVKDNGRGIPTDIMEKLFTSLNMGSNIDTSEKNKLKTDILGQNGTGTLALCSLSEHIVITSFRGGTENKVKRIEFKEGIKVAEAEDKCTKKEHGLLVHFKPSKILGKNTKFIWKDIQHEVENLQYLNKENIKIDLTHVLDDENAEHHSYSARPFVEILSRNSAGALIGSQYQISGYVEGINEELDGELLPRFIGIDVAFGYTNVSDPYIDSFSNSNNTVDGGDHIDGTMEAICRFFQSQTKASMSDKEKEKLDIKWDDVKSGMSIVVSIRTNWERLYTGQTKHKIVSSEIRNVVQQLVLEELKRYFTKNTGKLKEIITIVKTNARARREGDKVKVGISKSTLSTFSAYSIKNFDPCSAKGKEYKEFFICEGDSARGALKAARDPKFQAIYAVRGVGANANKLTLSQIVGPNGNRIYTEVAKIWGGGFYPNFDINKMAYNLVAIATDGDIDGFYIRSLWITYLYQYYRELIEAGRVYIAEPPLYRVNDKKNPFVRDKAEYTHRYCIAVSKQYRIGYPVGDNDFKWLNKKEFEEFLGDTRYYVDDLQSIGNHYMMNDRLLEIILYETIDLPRSKDKIIGLNIPKLMDTINAEYPELYFDVARNAIIGSIDAKPQTIIITTQMLNRADVIGLSDLIRKYRLPNDERFLLHNIKSQDTQKLSMLELLKILKKFQPDIEHRFKGLGENDPEDLWLTVMNPDTRSLIKVTIGDVENNDAMIQLLRGNTPLDRLNRKDAYMKFKIDRDMIDT